MSALAIIAGLTLAGQVVNAGGNANRYGSPPTNPSAAAPSNTSPLSPINSPSAATSSQPNPFIPSNNSTTTSPSSYGRPGQLPNAAGTVSPPPGRPATTSQPLNTNPWQQDATSTSPPANDPNSALKPAGMMRAMLNPPRDSRLPGEPVGLDEIITGASSRMDQTQRIEAYWDLCSSVADYYLGVLELNELRRLRQAGGSISAQMESEISVRLGTSQRAALASQYRLASLSSRSGSLPLPADIPHCGDYQCRYDEIFSGRPNPEGQELSQLIPLRYTELKDAATAVRRAEDGFDSVATGRDESSVFRALELLALRRRAFVQIARDYNRRIARYCELAAPGQVDSDRLVGMLIRRNTATATRPSLLSPPPNRQTQTTPESKPLTFIDGAEGWSATEEKSSIEKDRDEAVAPASAVELQELEPRREKSLLVTPPH